MPVTPIPVLRDCDLCGLSALASMLLRLAMRGDCTTADFDTEEHIYAVPGSPLSVVSQLHIDGAMSLIVREGTVDQYRLWGDSEAALCLECNGSVTVYDTAHSAGQLTADQLEHLHRAIALGV